MSFQRIPTLLALAGFAAAIAAASDTCQTFQEDGECFDLQSFYVNGAFVNKTRDTIDAADDATTASIYNQ